MAIHAISAWLKLGDPRTATETGEALDLAAMPVGLVGRRTQVNLDLARAYAMTRKDAAAVNLLLAAERLSPQLVRYDLATGDVLTELLRREHRPVDAGAAASCAPRWCDLTGTFVRVSRPHRDPGSLPSPRCGSFQHVLPSLIAGQMRRPPGGTKWRNGQRAGCGWYLTNMTRCSASAGSARTIRQSLSGLETAGGRHALPGAGR